MDIVPFCTTILSISSDSISTHTHTLSNLSRNYTGCNDELSTYLPTKNIITQTLNQKTNHTSPFFQDKETKMAQRVTYRRRLSYNTRSNRVHIVKTPGGRLTYQYTKRPANGPKCGDCGCKLAGVCIFIFVFLVV